MQTANESAGPRHGQRQPSDHHHPVICSTCYSSHCHCINTIGCVLGGGGVSQEPHFDERLPMREDRPDLNFNEKRRAITTDAEWRAVIADQPWTASKRRQMLSAYLHAKLDAGDDLLAEEGCAGFWELSISKDNHADIRMDRLASLLSKLSSNNVPVATAAAAAVWGLATTAGMRRSMSDLDVVSLVVANLKKTLKMQVCRESRASRVQRWWLRCLKRVVASSIMDAWVVG